MIFGKDLTSLRGQSIGFWAFNIARAFKCRFAEALEGMEISPVDAFTMIFIGAAKEISLVRLSREIGHSHPAVLRTIDRLEERGLIRRTVSATDRRVKIISLTDAGQDLIPVFTEKLLHVHERAVNGFSDEDVDVIRERMMQMIENLGFSTEAVNIHPIGTDIPSTKGPDI